MSGETSAVNVINAKSGKYAILGDPIGHSLSPVIMNSMFARHGIDSVLLAFAVNRENVGRLYPALLELGFDGFVLTMPVKEDVARLVDRLEDEAALTGATNCVVNRGGATAGHNTDSIGFWTSILEKAPAAPESVFILGGGGMAKAAAAQAAIQGAKRLVVACPARDAEFFGGFRRFVDDRLLPRFPDLRATLVDWDPQVWAGLLGEADVVANATPNGLNGKGDLDKIFPYRAVRKEAVFFDAIYSPLETAFLAAARERGHATVGGLDLLAHQGVRTFKIWTGADVSPAEMKRDALQFLEDVQ